MNVLYSEERKLPLNIMKSINELENFLEGKDYDIIVVEGYDGVGKGKILNELANKFNIIPYRPDYNFWQNFDHRYKDRWKISGFFLDVYSHFTIKNKTPLLFDRGVISGAVYNDDSSIAKNYKSIIKGLKVLHIIVSCSFASYLRFYEARGITPITRENVHSIYDDYVKYTQRYYEMMKIAEVEYITYMNEYDENYYNNTFDRCISCGHYSYGMCRHPSKNYKVDPNSSRCSLSTEKEVQDEYAGEVHSV